MALQKPNQQAKTADAEQYRRFVEKARELGCDEDEAAFDAKLRAIARQKPKDEAKPKKGAGRAE
jgi:hypothetical protein